VEAVREAVDRPIYIYNHSVGRAAGRRYSGVLVWVIAPARALQDLEGDSMSVITARKDEGVLVVISNNPPVNALGVAVRSGLADAIRREILNGDGLVLPGAAAHGP
jgi:hypothetical protein